MSEPHSSTPRLHALITAFALLALGACGDGPAGYFPLEADRYWQYDVVKTTMDGSVTQRYLIETRPARDWNGNRVYVKQTVDGHQYYYRIGSAGIERVARKLRGEETVVPAEPAVMVLPNAPALGDRWQQDSYTAALENTGPPWETLFRITKPVVLEYTVASLADTVRVPAGKFTGCLRLVGSGRFNAEVGNYIGRAEITVDVTEWYAPGVGLVRTERIERTDADVLNHGAIVMELATYR